MMDIVIAIVAFALLVLGVAGSLVPQLPGAPFSIAGVLIYWWGSGFSEPGLLVLVVLLAIGILTVAVAWLGGVVGAKAGGASTKTAIAAGVAGIVLFFAGLGPIGLLLGVALTVFVLEFYRERDTKSSARAAIVTTAAMLGSAIVQALLTGSMLIAMLGVALF